MKACVGLIPARSGSKRIPNKNIYPINGHPLIAYTIIAAIKSGVFKDIICVTDDQSYAEIAIRYGASVPKLRPKEISGDASPDIDWVKWILNVKKEEGVIYENYGILRPTNPFRNPETIRSAYEKFVSLSGVDSMRAVTKCSEHPGKMWIIKDDRMLPILPYSIGEVPWHSNQYNALPEIYVQDASMEFSKCEIALRKSSISGVTVVPHISLGYEGFDINYPEDLIILENNLKSGKFKIDNLNKN